MGEHMTLQELSILGGLVAPVLTVVGVSVQYIKNGAVTPEKIRVLVENQKSMIDSNAIMVSFKVEMDSFKKYQDKWNDRIEAELNQARNDIQNSYRRERLGDFKDRDQRDRDQR